MVDSCSHGSKFLVTPATNQADCLDEGKKRATNEPTEPLGSTDRHKRAKPNPGPEGKGTCSVCHLHACAPLDTVAQLQFDQVILDLQSNLGVSMTQAKAERHQCEVSALANWCILQGDVISKSGEFLPDRIIPHDTTASIDLTVDNPKLKARPDKSSPQHKLDIAEMVEAKLRQGIIEKSSAPWSSNCVVIRKDGKTRIAVDYRKLNEVTVHDSYLLPKISEIYETLSGTEWFTSLDATQASSDTYG